jgi:phosphocarrier protein HPr
VTLATVKVVNRLGLHARPAAKVVDCAARYASDIKLIYDEKEVDAKSIMSVLMLAAPCGAKLSLKINGDDEAAALQAMTELFATGFGELE